MFKKIKNRKGFTLIELIVVIAILAVLAAIIIPTVSSSIQRANEARDLANSRSIYAQVAIDVLSNETGAGSYNANGEPAGVECRYTVSTGGTISAFECNTPTGFYVATLGQVDGPSTTVTAFTINP
ncbi:MAG: type II secretion system GspH family protein [Erysipelotrichaceae bacterium]|nr:type II secretion system GspH family protein [Erysipelotrichaceae bacterium]